MISPTLNLFFQELRKYISFVNLFNFSYPEWKKLLLMAFIFQNKEYQKR